MDATAYGLARREYEGRLSWAARARLVRQRERDAPSPQFGEAWRPARPLATAVCAFVLIVLLRAGAAGVESGSGAGTPPAGDLPQGAEVTASR